MTQGCFCTQAINELTHMQGRTSLCWRCYHNRTFTIMHSQCHVHDHAFTVMHTQSLIHNSPFTVMHSQSCIHIRPFTIMHSQSCVHSPAYTITHSQSCIHSHAFTTMHSQSRTHDHLFTFTHLQLCTHNDAFTCMCICTVQLGTDLALLEMRSQSMTVGCSLASLFSLLTSFPSRVSRKMSIVRPDSCPIELRLVSTWCTADTCWTAWPYLHEVSEKEERKRLPVSESIQ